MLRMLYRYENRFYAKIMSLCYLILAGVLLVGRLIMELYSYLESSLPEDSGLFLFMDLPVGLVNMLAFGAVCGVVIVPQILLAVRFWKNLIRDGGYLSLTLPVKPQAHVGCKIITSFIWTVISAVVALALSAAAVLIFNKEAVDGLVRFVDDLGQLEIISRSELVIGILLLVLSGLLLALATAARTAFSMSMGQLTRKNKLLVAVGCWFGMGIAWDIISTMANVVAMIPAIDAMEQETMSFYLMSLVLPFIIANAAVSVLFIVICWCVSNYIFKNKINLE